MLGHLSGSISLAKAAMISLLNNMYRISTVASWTSLLLFPLALSAIGPESFAFAGTQTVASSGVSKAKMVKIAADRQAEVSATFCTAFESSKGSMLCIGAPPSIDSVGSVLSSEGNLGTFVVREVNAMQNRCSNGLWTVTGELSAGLAAAQASKNSQSYSSYSRDKETWVLFERRMSKNAKYLGQGIPEGFTPRTDRYSDQAMQFDRNGDGSVETVLAAHPCDSATTTSTATNSNCAAVWVRSGTKWNVVRTFSLGGC
jgi:hypothetical protein